MSWLSVKLGKFIYSALQQAKEERTKRERGSDIQLGLATAKSSNDPLDIQMQQTTFTVVKAANGKLVKVSYYKPTKSHHSDWQHEIYIVKDDEKVPDVIARVMAINALEQ